MKVILILYFAVTFCCIWSCSDKKPGIIPEQKVNVFNPVAISKNSDVKIYAHYMPWFENKESSTSGKWGIHWTMSSKNPDDTDDRGKRQIASHFYPTIGPYASGDRDLIDYHLLLMKYAGIDGIIIDWYGIHNINDYVSIKTNTEAIASRIEDVGLTYAIDYEDRTLGEVVTQGLATSKVAGATEDIQYLRSKFFSKPGYIKINNRPLLLTFGPIQLQTEDDWTAVFSNINPKPFFLTLWNESGDAGKNASGEYSWVFKNNSYLDNFYNRINTLALAMGSAYPGFNDFYKEGGWGESLGWIIEHNNGATFDEMLAKAGASGVNHIQLITWNDFGEGTMIEPTSEFGYMFLEKIKAFTGINGYDDVFSSITRQYLLRKKLKSNDSAQKSLDQAFYYFVSLQAEKAVQVVDSLQVKYP